MVTTGTHTNKRLKTFYFHEEWETEFCFTNVNDKCVFLICSASVSVGKRCNREHHFAKVHSNFSQDFPEGSSLRQEKIKELKTVLKRQQSLFTKPAEKANAHIFTTHKKPFTDGL